jgi:hypothetical protein
MVLDVGRERDQTEQFTGQGRRDRGPRFAGLRDLSGGL